MNHSSKNYDVIILGAGAAGLICAFTAAQRGKRVLVLEKANKVGKKILMSGGGRCNFTNYYATADNFISNNPHFPKSALSRYTKWDFIALVEQHGIEYEERSHGQLFCKGSAKEILSMLLQECDAVGVRIETLCEGIQLKGSTTAEVVDKEVLVGQPHRYQVSLKQNGSDLSYTSHSIVIATGALSIPTLGGSGFGYDVAARFHIPITERRASLVPVMLSDHLKPICERLSGLSVPIEVSCNDQVFKENMLFTHRGISGPAILQISNYWLPGDQINVNLLPNINAARWLVSCKSNGKVLIKTLLNRKLPRSLVKELALLWWPESTDKPIAEHSDKQLTEIGKKLNKWQIKPSATEGYRTAEVTLGGVDTHSISSKTMEAQQQPGLYFVGEVLDVTGHLGGFNFQWAWSSGYTAGLFV